METKSVRAWKNQKTGETDCLPEGVTTDEQAIQYISQQPVAQAMCKAYRLGGRSISEAMINVLSACLGQEHPYPLVVVEE